MAGISLGFGGIDLQEAKRLLSNNPDHPTPYLKLFWSDFNWKICEGECKKQRRYMGTCGTQNRKITLLRAMTLVKVHRQRIHRRRYQIRRNFHMDVAYLSDDAVCFCCRARAFHRHHIIQIQNGGGNSNYNIVPLCRECHRLVHSR